MNSQASIRCHCFNLGGFGVRNSGSVEISGAVDFPRSQDLAVLLPDAHGSPVLKHRASFAGNSNPCDCLSLAS